MKKILLTLSIILLSTVFALSSMHHSDHKNHGDVPFKKSMDKMHKDMMMKSSGNIDIDFLKGMIPHHQGAGILSCFRLRLQLGRHRHGVADDL